MHESVSVEVKRVFKVRMVGSSGGDDGDESI